MQKQIIVDAGPLVALCCKTDQYHQWAMSMVDTLPLPWYTSELVIAEACYLLLSAGFDPLILLENIKSGRIQIQFSLKRELNSVMQLMLKYQDQPMDLADASLVRMSELETDCEVFTVDRNDFQVYRRFGRQEIPIIAPPARP